MAAGFEDEPRIPGREFVHVEKSSVKLVRNAKGDTQIEMRVVDGTTDVEMARLRLLALAEYRTLVEATGGLLPEPTA